MKFDLGSDTRIFPLLIAQLRNMSSSTLKERSNAVMNFFPWDFFKQNNCTEQEVLRYRNLLAEYSKPGGFVPKEITCYNDVLNVVRTTTEKTPASYAAYVAACQERKRKIAEAKALWSKAILDRKIAMAQWKVALKEKRCTHEEYNAACNDWNLYVQHATEEKIKIAFSPVPTK